MVILKFIINSGFLYHLYLTSELFFNFEVNESEMIPLPKLTVCYDLFNVFNFEEFKLNYNLSNKIKNEDSLYGVEIRDLSKFINFMEIYSVDYLFRKNITNYRVNHYLKNFKICSSITYDVNMKVKKKLFDNKFDFIKNQIKFKNRVNYEIFWHSVGYDLQSHKDVGYKNKGLLGMRSIHQELNN